MPRWRYDGAVPPLRYVALGDSYTIGTGLPDPSENFPTRLARQLTEATGIDVTVVNLGVNGYTTRDLIREELPVARAAVPDFVTVLIGANDVVQGSDEESYRRHLQEIYQAIAQLELRSGRTVAISIPDFSGVPGGAGFGPAADLRARIEAFNQVARSQAGRHGLGYVDITALSRSGMGRADWLAADGLHPAAAQHRAIAADVWEAVSPAWRSVQPA